MLALLFVGDIAWVGWQRSGTAVEEGYALARAAPHVRLADVDGDCVASTVPSPDETMLAATNWYCESYMELVDLRTGEVVNVGDGQGVGSVAWAPGGRRLALGVYDGTAERLHIYHLDSGELRPHEPLADEAFGPHRWSPDGEWLAGKLRDEEGDVSVVVTSLESHETRTLTRGVRADQGLADFSPDGRYVVFSEFDGLSDDLVVMDMSTGARWPLTAGPEDDGGALWSPDGGTIAYTNEGGLWGLPVSAGRRVGEPRLLRAEPVSPQAWTEDGYFYQADNTVIQGHKIEVDPASGHPNGHRERFALPDGRLGNLNFRWAPLSNEGAEPAATPEADRMAAAGWGEGRIHLMSGGNTTSFDVGPEFLPSRIWWSPDGEELLFTTSDRAQADRSVRTVHALDLAQGGVREMFPPLEGISHTHVSPDGTRMVSFQPENGRPRQKMVVSEIGQVDGVVVARAGAHADFATNYGQPLFSPDGSKIVFLRFRQSFGEGDQAGELWVVGADGSDERRLASARWIAQPPQWDPSGRMIAYTEEREGDRFRLMVVSVETGEQWEILDLDDLGETRLQDWSPDGRWIGLTEEIGRNELWIDRDLLEHYGR